jgi:hypothetical protein
LGGMAGIDLSKKVSDPLVDVARQLGIPLRGCNLNSDAEQFVKLSMLYSSAKTITLERTKDITDPVARANCLIQFLSSPSRVAVRGGDDDLSEEFRKMLLSCAKEIEIKNPDGCACCLYVAGKDARNSKIREAATTSLEALVASDKSPKAAGYLAELKKTEIPRSKDSFGGVKKEAKGVAVSDQQKGMDWNI